jgi:PKD repeat protein
MLAIINAAIAMVACSQTDSGLSNKSVAFSTCAGSQKPAINPEGLEINGSSGAQKGEAVRYALSEDLSCNKDQTVTWKAVAGGSNPQAIGSAYVASFKKAGEYVVSASISDPSSTSPYVVATKTIVSADLAVNAPQISMAEITTHLSLAVPAGMTLASANWNFGDGSPAVSSTAAQDHTYWQAGDYMVQVDVVDSNGDTASLAHAIHVLPPTDGLECVTELSTSGPTTAAAGNPVTVSAFIPQCVAFRLGALAWNFGDGTATDANQTATHTYAAAGTYDVTLNLIDKQGAVFLTLNRTMEITGEGTDPDPEDPPPTDPGVCSTVGSTQTIDGDIMSEEVACGVNGTKTVSYRNHLTQTCQLVNEMKRWVTTSTSKEVLSEGPCKGQACELPAAALTGVDQIALGIIVIGGKYYLPDGTSKTFYSSQTPNGQCSEVATTRTCNNGVLGGSTSNVYLLCHNGCPGIGPSGTTVSGVVVGEISVPKTCQYGETGITDIFTQIADKTCESGEVKTSNVRQGTIKTAGVCPTYNWGGTENYGACSADCGGTQTRVFECRDSKGQPAPADRCIDLPPVETRLCDGNPAAVRRSESSTTLEDASSSTTCPANQIGTVTKTREVTTTKVYACINHQVGLESTSVNPGPWVEEKYCKELVPHRCSQDSLSNEEANGRYLWMMKCRATVPVIDQFLTAFEKFEKATIYHQDNLILDGRIVYPTFMDASKKPEKPWIAPKTKNASCVIPAKAYIATVCLASCFTPEQPIMAQKEANGSLNYVKIYDAWDQQFKFAATLGSNSTMSSKVVKKTPVDQWITELIDTNHDILEFTMKSGRQLRLTPNHPVLNDQGAMQTADQFKVGDNLVELGGHFDPIVKIDKVNYYGKVYNLFVKSAAIQNNVVVTNGYLNGTAFFQNEGATYLNRKLLRDKLIKGALR